MRGAASRDSQGDCWRRAFRRLGRCFFDQRLGVDELVDLIRTHEPIFPTATQYPRSAVPI